jgi:dTDP-4-dehydrorhamnose reductase
MEEGCTALPGALTVRTAAFYSAQDRYNFAVAVVHALSNGRHFRAAEDHVVSPTFVPALVDAALDLLIDGTEGLCHLAGADPVSWATFARRVAEAVGLDEKLIDGVPGASLGWTAARPLQVGLASERCAMLGSLDNSIRRFADDFGRRNACLKAA